MNWFPCCAKLLNKEQQKAQHFQRKDKSKSATPRQRIHPSVCLPLLFLYSLSAAFLPAAHIILHRDVRFWWSELTFSLCPLGTTCSFPESELTSPAPGGLTVSRWRELGIIKKKKKIFFLGGGNSKPLLSASIKTWIQRSEFDSSKLLAVGSSINFHAPSPRWGREGSLGQASEVRSYSAASPPASPLGYMDMRSVTPCICQLTEYLRQPYPHFTGDETEAQEGEAVCLNFHSQGLMESDRNCCA